ncbi:unnamed protein product [Musa acuminata subsp. burmannicoides]
MEASIFCRVNAALITLNISNFGEFIVAFFVLLSFRLLLIYICFFFPLSPVISLPF